jgi:hypothetical protein
MSEKMIQGQTSNTLWSKSGQPKAMLLECPKHQEEDGEKSEYL